MNLRVDGSFLVSCMGVLLFMSCRANSSSLERPLNGTDGDSDSESTIDEILSAPRPQAKPGASAALSSQVRRKTELDILLTEEQWQTRESRITNNNSRSRRDTITTVLWPNATIPYVIKETFRGEHLTILRAAMETLGKYTCVKFQDAKHYDQDFVEIHPTLGCSSYVGRIQGAQALTLESYCFKKGESIVLHELAHAIGLQHEHNRPDRDDYVSIIRENIQREHLHNFEKVDEAEPYIGIPYNYLSLMHYGKTAFAFLGTKTIEAKKKKYEAHMGRARDLNFEDIKLINTMYRCSAHCPEISCPGEGFVGKDCNCWCPSIHRNSSIMPCYDYFKTCGGAMFASQKPMYIRSPGYPTSYPSRSNCLWTLQTTSGNGSIFLQIKNLSTEECCDRLIIYDNKGFEIKLSGNKTLFEITLGPRAVISFTSDDLVQQGGFEITFTALSAQILPHTVNVVQATKSKDPCHNYVALNDSWRRVTHEQGRKMCDKNLLLPDTWYRIMPPAGTQIPETVPPLNRCGTEAPMWLNGSHPTIESRGIVERSLCAHWNGNACMWSTTVQVLLCSAGYYLYKAPVSATSHCNSTWCAVWLPPPPPRPERFAAISSTTIVPKYFGGMRFTQDGHILVAARSEGLIEYTADGRELSRWQLPNQKEIQVYGLAVLSDGRVAVCFLNHKFVAILSRRGDSMTIGDAWAEDRRLDNLNLSAGRLSVHGDVLTVLELFFNFTSQQWLHSRKIDLINVTSGARLTTLHRGYDIRAALITAHLIITISQNQGEVNNGIRLHVVDGHSRASDRRLWRYHLDTTEEYVYNICADYAGRVLYVSVHVHRENKGRLAAISLDDGKELRRYAHSLIGRIPYDIAIGRVRGHSVLAVAQWNTTQPSHFILTVHPYDDA